MATRMRLTLMCVVLLMSTGSLRGQSDLAERARIEAAVKAAYWREFAETIEHPAIYNEPGQATCSGPRPATITTTAYLTSGASTRLLTMFLSQEGTVLQRISSQVPLRPAGTIRVLAVLVRYPETFSDEALALWENGQKQVNEDHAALARSRGYQAPIVVFSNTNIMIEPGEIDDPHRPASVRAVAERHGLSPADHQIVMMIDMNPGKSAGGLSIGAEKSVYLGNFEARKTPLDGRAWSGLPPLHTIMKLPTTGDGSTIGWQVAAARNRNMHRLLRRRCCLAGRTYRVIMCPRF
jgi:hypothetical protein